MSEIVCLEISAVLWLIHVLVQGGVGNAAFPAGYLTTARDTQLNTENVYFERQRSDRVTYTERRSTSTCTPVLFKLCF